MKRLERKNQFEVSYTVPAANGIVRFPDLSARFLVGGEPLTAMTGCLKCPGAPCVRLEQQPGTLVCPVDAISQDPLDGTISISQKCIGCGLCLLQCLPGALSMGPDGQVTVGEWGPSNELKESSAIEHLLWSEGMDWTSVISREAAKTKAQEISKRLEKEKASVIYPLVASYFGILGLPASASNRGDTSSRVDVIIQTEKGIIPAEVKSFTEVDSINLKSVQQALENKLFAARQSQRNSLDSLSSLALGFNYPSDRTGILDLVEDIHKAFGIRIGLVSLPRLIEEAILSRVNGDFDASSRLMNLKGIF